MEAQQQHQSHCSREREESVLREGCIHITVYECVCVCDLLLLGEGVTLSHFMLVVATRVEAHCYYYMEDARARVDGQALWAPGTWAALLLLITFSRGNLFTSQSLWIICLFFAFALLSFRCVCVCVLGTTGEGLSGLSTRDNHIIARAREATPKRDGFEMDRRARLAVRHGAFDLFTWTENGVKRAERDCLLDFYRQKRRYDISASMNSNGTLSLWKKRRRRKIYKRILFYFFFRGGEGRDDGASPRLDMTYSVSCRAENKTIQLSLSLSSHSHWRVFLSKVYTYKDGSHHHHHRGYIKRTDPDRYDSFQAQPLQKKKRSARV